MLVQEYGRYFGMHTACFRGGCLTGPGHQGAELHGFLSYLVKCGVTGRPYTVFGYKGKQVRDNIHSADLIAAFDAFRRNPKPAAVYHIGDGRFSNCSMLEAIDLIDELGGGRVHYTLSDQARSGDHIWWISDVRRFQRDYPQWRYTLDLRATLAEMIDATRERLRCAA
jgi:CDP-paratose 2-epimerase